MTIRNELLQAKLSDGRVYSCLPRRSLGVGGFIRGWASLSGLSGTTEAIVNHHPGQFVGRSLSAAQTAWDHPTMQSSHRSRPNLCCLQKTNEYRNTRQTNESDPR